MKIQRILALLPLTVVLSACSGELLNPSGDVAVQIRDVTLWSALWFGVPLLLVSIATVLLAWRYRASNAQAYDPTWKAPAAIQLLFLGVPTAIVAVVGVTTWNGAHQLDPYLPLSRIAPDQPVPPGTKPLVIQAIALDWKWLFIYPDYGIATVNDLAAPVNQPIEFRMTADRVQNALAIPAMMGMVYAMPGMETEMHAVINKPGDYKGRSSRFSGIGFSKMTFTFHGLSNEDFDKWIAEAKTAGGSLDTATFQQLAVPTIAEPIHRYASVDPQLYKLELDQCLGKSPDACLSTQRANDYKRGNGLCRPNVASNY